MWRRLVRATTWSVLVGCGSRTGLPTGETSSNRDGGSQEEASGPERDASTPEGGFADVRSRDASGDGGAPDGSSGDGGSGACSTGLFTLATKQSSPAAIGVDAEHLYWTNFVGGTVMTVPLCGGAPTTLATSAGPTYIAVDSRSVYWTQSEGAECPSCISILKVPSSGGTSTRIASQVNASSLGMAVNATNAYWAARGGGVMVVPSGGGALATLAPELAGMTSGIALDSVSAYFTYTESSPTPTPLDVMSVPLAGGAPVLLASGPTVASGALPSIAVNSTGIYWGTPTAIVGMLKGGGAPSSLAVAWGPTGPGDMVVDDANVYWVNRDQSAVLKAPLAGGSPVTLATAQSHPRGVAVDATSVYWATASSAGPDYYGDLMKLTPK